MRDQTQVLGERPLPPNTQHPTPNTHPNLRRPTPNLRRAGRPPRRFTRFVAGAQGPSLRVTTKSPMLSILYSILRDHGRSMSCAELCQRYHEYVTGQPLPVTAIPLSMENKVHNLMTRGDPMWHVDALILLDDGSGEG
jgi:hypothetical protein